MSFWPPCDFICKRIGCAQYYCNMTLHATVIIYNRYKHRGFDIVLEITLQVNYHLHRRPGFERFRRFPSRCLVAEGWNVCTNPCSPLPRPGEWCETTTTRRTGSWEFSYMPRAVWEIIIVINNNISFCFVSWDDGRDERDVPSQDVDTRYLPARAPVHYVRSAVNFVYVASSRARFSWRYRFFRHTSRTRHKQLCRAKTLGYVSTLRRRANII